MTWARASEGAICSRASSSAARARRLGQWVPEGLPKASAMTIGGVRDGIREDAFERAGSHLAEEYAREEILLGLGRPRHETA